MHVIFFKRSLMQSTYRLNFRSIHHDEVSREMHDAIRFSIPGARSRSTTVCSCGGGTGEVELSPIKTKLDLDTNDKDDGVSGLAPAVPYYGLTRWL